MYFSGTSYLGLAQLPEFKELIKEGIDKVGTHFGGSRLSNIQIAVFEEAENKLAECCGAESALLLSSGSQAGYMVAQIKTKSSHVSAIPGTHSALWSHFLSDMDSEDNFWKRDTPNSKGEMVILSNTVDSLFCQPSPLADIKLKSDQTDSLVIADDSHGIGILGEDGRGLFRKWQSELRGELIFMGSLGKGMGLPAGFILGSEVVIEAIKSSRTFGGSSPPNPAFLYAWLNGEQLYRQQWERLRANINQFTSSIRNLDHFDFIEGYPVFHIKNEGLDDIFLKNGIVISSFHYPGPQDPKVSRIVLNALHSREDIEQLLFFIREFIV